MTHGSESASAWVERFLAQAPRHLPVLDLAAGSGRHTRLARHLGFRVSALDRETSRLPDDPEIEVIAADLEADPWPLPGRRFGAVVVTNYLHRPLLPHVVAAVEAGGLLIYETFARGNEAFGKPTNPAFLLEEAELLAAVGGELSVLAYEHGFIEHPRRAIVQRIAAWRPGGRAYFSLAS